MQKIDKSKLILEKIENYQNEKEVDDRQGKVLYESLESQYEIGNIQDELDHVPVVYKCLSSVNGQISAKTKFVFTSDKKALLIRYLTIEPEQKPFFLYEFDSNNNENILYEIKHGKKYTYNYQANGLFEHKYIIFKLKDNRLHANDVEWLDTENNLISTGLTFPSYNLKPHHNSAIKLRINWSFNGTQFELKLIPSEFLKSYDKQWSNVYKPSPTQYVGHYKSNSSSPSSSLKNSQTINIEVSGALHLGYFRFVCQSGSL